MKTDDLIAALGADVAAEAAVAGGLGWRLALALAGCIGLVGLVLEFRPDLAQSLVTPISALRLVLTLALLALGVRFALVLGRPEGRVRLWPLAGVVLAAGAAVVWTLVTTPAGSWGMAVQGKTMVWCLTSIPTLSVLPVAVLFVALRRGATTRPVLAGAMIGLAGSGGAAAAYALHCPEDNPLFYVTWYGVAILIVTGVSAVLARRLLRW